MRRTLIQSIILIILIIISSIIIISGTLRAQSTTIVQGYVYIDNTVTRPQELYLTFPTNTITATLHDDGSYIIMFSGIEGESSGEFTVVYLGHSYNPLETVLFRETESEYTIDLHVTISNVDEQIAEFENTSNLPPKADAGGPYSGMIGDVVQFDGSNSSDLDGTIRYYQWWFGDGSMSTLQKPTHTYTADGNFTVTLTVTDDSDLTSENITYVTVSKIPTTPPFIPMVSGVNASHVHLVCSYTFIGSDADGDMIRYVIHWDDGTNDTMSSLLPTNTSFSTEHYWSTGGIYHVAAYIEDEHNATSPVQTFEVWIDVHACGSLGVLIDKNGDGIYDVLYQKPTGIETVTDHYNNLYTIDIDDDGQWEYTYDPVTQEILVYQPPESGHSNLFSLADPSLIVILVPIGLMGVLCVGILVKLKKRHSESTSKLFYVREHTTDHDEGEPSGKMENPEDPITACQPDNQQFLEELRHHMEQMKKEE